MRNPWIIQIQGFLVERTVLQHDEEHHEQKDCEQHRMP